MKEEKEILNRSINKGEKALGRVFPKRVSEKEYVGGYYLPKQDLHQILETLFKLKLKSQDEEGNAGYLVAKKQKHPNLFWLVDSIEARQDLRALIPLLDLLSRVQKMPDDMCDLGSFEHAMALNPKQIRPFVKNAIIEGRTYIDPDGKEKPLVQFYVEKLQHNGKDVYGVCVPRTAQGQKALLKLAGFNIHPYDFSKHTERERAVFDGIKTGTSLRDLAKYYNVTKERIRQIYAKMYRKIQYYMTVMLQVYLIQDKSSLEPRQLTDKDALYITDSDGDFVITQAALKRGLIRGYGASIPRRFTCKSKEKIIRFDRETRE